MEAIIIVILLIGGVYIAGILSNNSKKVQSKELTSDLSIQIVSFVVPLVGFIFGSISFGKDTIKDKELGMKCILLGVLAIIVWIFIGLLL